MLINAKWHWLEAITTMLWPYGVKAAWVRHNRFHMNDDCLSPLELFSRVETTFDLKLDHTWGCPVYIMDAKLQYCSGGLSKWEPRVHLGSYLGHSPVHSGSIAMVLNPKTGHVSPQYHIVFDDNFTTVPYMRAGDMPPNWLDLVKRSSELATLEQFDAAKTWFEQDLEGEPDRDEATHAVAETGKRTQQQVDPTYPPPTFSVPSLPNSFPEVASFTNKGIVFPLDPAPAIPTSTARKGDVNPALILKTSTAMMP